MSEIKLLPCPFCGGEARVRDCTREEQTTIVNGQMHKMCGCKDYCVEMFGYTEEEAIKKWNTRKPMERIIERLKENSNFLLHEMGDSKMYAGNESAIEIVKEECGINE